MNEDYLWDKSGTDAELEALEASLSVFQMKDERPPVVVVAASGASPGQSRRWREFSWSFLIPVAVALVLVVSGVYFTIPSVDRGAAITEVNPFGSEQASVPAIEMPAQSEPTEIVPVAAPPQDKKITTPVVVRDADMSRRNAPVERRRVARPVKQIKIDVAPAPALTAEEKYAYDQLMLALSITGSKLRIVQDKIRHTDAAVAAGK